MREHLKPTVSNKNQLFSLFLEIIKFLSNEIIGKKRVSKTIKI